MHIKDVVAAFDIILHQGQTGAIYNVGSSEEFSVLEIAEFVCMAFGVDAAQAISFVLDRG